MTRRGWGLTSHEGREVVEGETAWALVAGLVLAVLLMALGDWIASALTR